MEREQDSPSSTTSQSTALSHSETTFRSISKRTLTAFILEPLALRAQPPKPQFRAAQQAHLEHHGHDSDPASHYHLPARDICKIITTRLPPRPSPIRDRGELTCPRLWPPPLPTPPGAYPHRLPYPRLRLRRRAVRRHNSRMRHPWRNFAR